MSDENPDGRRAITLRQRWKLWRGVPRSIRRSMLTTVPTTPGRYLDGQGHDWTLDNRGRWHDRHGVTAHPRNNWLLGQFTFTRIPDSYDTDSYSTGGI